MILTEYLCALFTLCKDFYNYVFRKKSNTKNPNVKQTVSGLSAWRFPNENVRYELQRLRARTKVYKVGQLSKCSRCDGTGMYYENGYLNSCNCDILGEDK